MDTRREKLDVEEGEEREVAGFRPQEERSQDGAEELKVSIGRCRVVLSNVIEIPTRSDDRRPPSTHFLFFRRMNLGHVS